MVIGGNSDGGDSCYRRNHQSTAGKDSGGEHHCWVDPTLCEPEQGAVTDQTHGEGAAEHSQRQDHDSSRRRSASRRVRDSSTELDSTKCSSTERGSSASSSTSRRAVATTCSRVMLAR